MVSVGYDAVKMLTKLISELDDVNSKNIQEKLKSYKYSGISGDIDFTLSRETDKREPILVVLNGKFKKL